MRIMYVTHSHANAGGMDKVIAYKANYLVERGYQIFLLTNSSKETESFFFFDPRIKIIHLESKAKKKYLNHYLAEVQSIFVQLKPDIVISTGEQNTRYLYKIKDGSKKILEVHFSKYRRNYWATRFDKIPYSWLVTDFFAKINTHIAKSFDRFVILTKEDQESWHYLKNATIMPNPLFSLPEIPSTCDNKQVLAIGRIVSQKSFHYLVEAWNIVHQKYPDWTLRLYGQAGKKENKIVHLIEKYNLQNSFIINPPTKEIEKEYQNSSIYAMTSNYEGQPLVLMEAMSHGLPVVSFACKCGPRDIISDGEDGFLVPFKDIKNFADKLCEIIKNEKLRKAMGIKARVNIQRYSLDKTMQKWIDLFNELTTTKD